MSECPEPKGPEQIQLVSGWKKPLYWLAAGIFFVLGALGAFLPGLPATPFLMLTSYFLIRSSPTAHRALLKSRIFGPILVDWQVNGGVRLHVKKKATVFVVLTVGLSILLTGRTLIPALGICGLAAVGLVVVWRLPEIKNIDR